LYPRKEISMKIRHVLAIGVLMGFGIPGVALAADPSRGSSTAPSPSGHEGADMEKNRGGNMGGMQRGETSLKQQERMKQDAEQRKKHGGNDPLEKQQTGPGSGPSSGVGAGQ
jgi:hypothetical protein